MNMIKENKALKSKIINLRNRRVSGAKEQHDIRPPLQRGNSTSSVMTITTSTNNNNNNSSHANSSPDFASIRAKLRLAEEEAKKTRAYCNTIKWQSERMKDRYDDACSAAKSLQEGVS